MVRMNVQQRYEDISRISGLSEDIIRRVFKATRQSLASSLKHGERATIPGICTITPEIKNRINIGGDSMSTYIKLKASASSAMEAELGEIDNFNSNEDDTSGIDSEEHGMKKLNFIGNHELPSFRPSKDQIRTTQINALL